MTDPPRVTPLRLARVELPELHPEGPGFDTVYGFLVRAGDDCLLVDTGIGVGSELIDRLYKPERVPLQDALAEAGASLDQLTAVVNSHLHFDHCGNNPLFPGVPIFVQRAELEAARADRYTVREWVDFPDARYVPVEGRHLLSERLELVPTPGHTSGHQSLLLRSAAGVDVVAAQAAYTAAEFERFRRADLADLDAVRGSRDLRTFLESNASWSEDAYVRSLAILRELAPDRAYFSHDSNVWQRGASHDG